jgi:hypothetical protein
VDFRRSPVAGGAGIEHAPDSLEGDRPVRRHQVLGRQGAGWLVYDVVSSRKRVRVVFQRHRD